MLFIGFDANDCKAFVRKKGWMGLDREVYLPFRMNCIIHVKDPHDVDGCVDDDALDTMSVDHGRGGRARHVNSGILSQILELLLTS